MTPQKINPINKHSSHKNLFEKIIKSVRTINNRFWWSGTVAPFWIKVNIWDWKRRIVTFLKGLVWDLTIIIILLLWLVDEISDIWIIALGVCLLVKFIDFLITKVTALLRRSANAVRTFLKNLPAKILNFIGKRIKIKPTVKSPWDKYHPRRWSKAWWRWHYQKWRRIIKNELQDIWDGRGYY